jgi:hypothetical protein
LQQSGSHSGSPSAPWFGNGGGVQNGIYFGAFNGTWWALLTSFAWPWITPERLDRWMYANTE